MIKRNYRQVSILSIISKIYERLLYKQLETCFESISISVCSENGSVCIDHYSFYDREMERIA